MRIFIKAAILCTGIFLSPTVSAEVYKACGNSLIGLHKAEENALRKALNAREHDGRNEQFAYKARVTFSVSELAIDDRVRDFTFVWTACVEVSDIPENVDILKRSACTFLYPWDISGKNFFYEKITALDYSLYLGPAPGEPDTILNWYRCAEIQEAPMVIENKWLCGESLERLHGAFEIVHEKFVNWYYGKNRFLMNAEKPVEIKYGAVRSALRPRGLDWKVCLVPPNQ